MRIPRIVGLAMVASASACGGDSATAPIPVATLTVTPAQADLVTNETRQLSAVVLDNKGNTLANREISWSSGSTSVATVSSSGLVSAVAPGSTTITATSEGQSSSATVNVHEGGVLGTNGGTVASADGAVRIHVPSGAAPAGLPITIAPTSSPPPPPAATHAVDGAAYSFGPDGTKFSSPATITIKYDPAALPGWVIPSDLMLQRWDGTQWSILSDIVVDPVAHTVTGKTPGFSTVGVYFRNPMVSITPGPGLVNHIQRSVTLSVVVEGEGRHPDALQVTWTNTGAHGTLDKTTGGTTQYTALSPILPAGDLDGITATIMGQFEPDGPFEELGVAATTVRSDLDLVVQLQPDRAVVGFSKSATFNAMVIDRRGNNVQYNNNQNLEFEWTATTTSGTLTPTGLSRNSTATYTAYPKSQQPNAGPRGDKITAKVTLVTYIQQQNLLGGGFKLDSTKTDLGTVEAFVQVMPDYTVKLVPPSSTIDAGGSVTLQAVIEPAWAEDEQLFFRWTTTGSQGSLSVNNGAPVTQSSVEYTANSNAPGGTDFVDLEVLVGTIGVLGVDRGSVSVNPRTTEVSGSYFVGPVMPADAGRSCVWAYIQFPVVPDAKQYDMHAFGFNDTLYWGTSIQESITTPLPPLPQFIGGSGVQGGNYYFFLTGGCGPNAGISKSISDMNARFVGMQVTVTVKF